MCDHALLNTVTSASPKKASSGPISLPELKLPLAIELEYARTLYGKLIAERAIEKGVKDVVFDRGGYIYHGRVKALADAAREAGLNF